MNPDRWLTSRRLCAHGLLLALALWGLYIWTIATPSLRDRNGNLKGTDFLHFYTLGSLAREHRGEDLYDTDAQASLASRLVPESEGIRYLPLYPPQFSLAFIPLTHLSYIWAFAVWGIFTTSVYGVCCYAVWRMCPRLRNFAVTTALLCFAYPAFFHLIAWGQTSALPLACFTGGFFLLRKKQEWAAGLVLGCVLFKPQLGMALLAVFLATKSWKIIAVIAISAAAQLAAGMAYYGWGPFRAWLRILANVPTLMPAFEPRPYHTHCLRTFWAMLVPWNEVSFALYAISAGVILVWAVLIWKSREPLSLRYAALLLATVLVSLHLTVYDLVILVPAMLLLVDWILSQTSPSNGMGMLVYLVCVLPLVGPFTRWIHVQLSVVAMVALLYLMWRMPIKFRRLAKAARSGAPAALTAEDKQVRTSNPTLALTEQEG